MTPARCVIQGCSSVSDNKAGISIHFSPKSKGHSRNQWVRFVRTKRSNFKPTVRFGVCSFHFKIKQFVRQVHIEGQERRLVHGAVPSVWKLQEESTLSKRDRRAVSVVTSLLLNIVLVHQLCRKLFCYK